MPTVTVHHNAIPPSSNTNTGVGGRGKPQAIGRIKGEWQGIFAVMLMEAKIPRRCTKVRVKAKLEFRTKHRRDADNFYFPVAKPLGDALTKGGWLVDDDYTRYEFERVEIEVGVTDLPPLAQGRTTLEIDYDTHVQPMKPQAAALHHYRT